MSPTPTPFGSWPSPLTARDVAAASLNLAYATAHRGRLFWTESRPQERGRSVLVTETSGGAIEDVTGAESNVRSRVHEYGGRAYRAWPTAGSLTASSPDQRLHVQRAGRCAARPDTRRLPLRGFRSRLRRAHSLRRARGPQRAGRAGQCGRRPIDVDVEPPVRVLSIAQTSSPPAPKCGRADRIHRRNHPNMPWDATTLYVARLRRRRSRGSARHRGRPGGSRPNPSIEPVWDVDGTLYFLSDRSGFWNLYRWKGGADRGGSPRSTRTSAGRYGISALRRTRSPAMAARWRASAATPWTSLVLVDLASGLGLASPLRLVRIGRRTRCGASVYAIAALRTAPHVADHVPPCATVRTASCARPARPHSLRTSCRGPSRSASSTRPGARRNSARRRMPSSIPPCNPQLQRSAGHEAAVARAGAWRADSARRRQR